MASGSLASTHPRDAGRSWIVCRGRTRDVVDGLVACPQQGAVGRSVCLDCHLLITSVDERDERISCSIAVWRVSEPR